MSVWFSRNGSYERPYHVTGMIDLSQVHSRSLRGSLQMGTCGKGKVGLVAGNQTNDEADEPLLKSVNRTDDGSCNENRRNGHKSVS